MGVLRPPSPQKDKKTMTNQDQDLPQEIERALLGALLLNPGLIPQIRELVAPGDLSGQNYRIIYETLISMPGQVDMITLTDQLRKAGRLADIGGSAYLAELVGADFSTARVGEYAKRIKQNSRAREAEALLRESLDKLKETPGDYRAILDQIKAGAEGQIRAADHEGAAIPFMRDILAEVEERIFNPKRKPIPTFSQGINENLNGGLQRGKVFTITGRAGGGKTTLALQIMEKIAQGNVQRKAKGEPLDICLYVHIEQGTDELVIKSYSRLGGINGGRFESQTILPDDERVEKARQIYSQEIAPYLCMYRVGAGYLLRDLKALVRKVDAQIREDHQLIVCVDPFQRLQTGERDLDKDEVRQVGAVASGLKTMAQDLQVSVILLSDTTKGAVRDMAEDKEPTGTEGRGSYMIEHATDISAVIQTYDKKSFQDDKSKEHGELVRLCGAYMDTEDARKEAAVYAVLSFSKQRSGGTGPVPFLYKKAYNQFLPLEEIPAQE